MSDNVSFRFDSYFQDTVLDNEGNNVCDINAGLVKLFGFYNENVRDSITEDERYLVSENEEGYPDLVARNSLLGSPDYWWWLLLLNQLEDPFMQLRANWVYSINSLTQITSIVNANNNATRDASDSRVGKVVELN